MSGRARESQICYGIGPYRTVAGLVLFAAIMVLSYLIAKTLAAPYSTPIELVDEQNLLPANPQELPFYRDNYGKRYVLGFVGDIMHHAGQVGDDFFACYRSVKPSLASCDLTIGNLEFPVHPNRPSGAGFQSARYNGSQAHLDALADAGFDILCTANNHAFDQGLDGVRTTLDLLRQRKVTAIGTGYSESPPDPELIELEGVRLAIVAYTMTPNSYPNEDGEFDYWPRDWPIHGLNFSDWRDEYRREGQQLFDRHLRAARESGAEFVVALVHWGREWHLRPSQDQRRAARDMIDAGFDLVVGSHSHVLNPPEIYGDALIAYSLGNFISDFVPWQTRVGAILKVALARTPAGVKVVDFQYVPTWTRRAGHLVVPLGSAMEHQQAPSFAEHVQSFAEHVLGPGLTEMQPAQ